MSALVTPGILRELELDRERHFGLAPLACCRFCRCTEIEPCAIPVREDAAGNFCLATNECEATAIVPCSWAIPGVCSSPECLEKLLAEARPVIFDAHGRRAG